VLGLGPHAAQGQATRYTGHLCIRRQLVSARRAAKTASWIADTSGETWLELTMAINTNSEQRQSQARRSCGPLSRGSRRPSRAASFGSRRREARS
jgi:hypothetical protein